MAKQAEIQVVGLGKLKRDLKRLGDDLGDLKQAHKRAAEAVAEDARKRVPVLTGRMKASIRAAGQAGGAVIRGGSKSVPYFGFIDFGGNTGIDKSVVRPFLPKGRVLYPAIDAQQKEVVSIFDREIEQLLNKYN